MCRPNLARTPGFSLTCVLVLSVGIASITAAFTVVMTAAKRPPTFHNPERLVLIPERNLQKGLQAHASNTTFVNWRDRSTVFQEWAPPKSMHSIEPQTVAGSIAVGVPRNWKKAVLAVRESGGTMINVSDGEITEAMRYTGSPAGIFAEPEPAAAIAGLRRRLVTALSATGREPSRSSPETG